MVNFLEGTNSKVQIKFTMFWFEFFMFVVNMPMASNQVWTFSKLQKTIELSERKPVFFQTNMQRLSHRKINQQLDRIFQELNLSLRIRQVINRMAAGVLCQKFSRNRLGTRNNLKMNFSTWNLLESRKYFYSDQDSGSQLHTQSLSSKLYSQVSNPKVCFLSFFYNSSCSSVQFPLNLDLWHGQRSYHPRMYSSASNGEYLLQSSSEFSQATISNKSVSLTVASLEITRLMWTFL